MMMKYPDVDLELEALEAVRAFTARLIGENPILAYCRLFYECRRPIYLHWYSSLNHPQMTHKMSYPILQALSYAYLAISCAMDELGEDGLCYAREHIVDLMVDEFCSSVFVVKTEYTRLLLDMQG